MSNEEIIDIVKTIKEKQPSFCIKIVPEAVIQNYTYCFYSKITDLKNLSSLLKGYAYQDLTSFNGNVFTKNSKYIIIHEASKS
jgi:hypothetical protein